MKNLFPEFYRPDEEELDNIWEEAHFVVDTNFLLNLYRINPDASTEIFDALKLIADRLWLPHQVALEFQKNRLTVIGDQKKDFEELKKVINEDGNKFIEKLDDLRPKESHKGLRDKFKKKFINLRKSFLKELSAEEECALDVFLPDPIRERLDKLFADKVGDPPANQAMLDTIYKEGAKRYEKKFPPGYMDEKEKGKNELYFFQGLEYETKYGDYVVWSQIMAQATSQKWHSVVFITDDEKEDWWWKEKGKKIGPRRELVEEIKRAASGTAFHMYNTSQFLKYVSEHRNMKVSPETITAVEEAIQRLRTTKGVTVKTTSTEDIILSIVVDLAHYLINNDENVVGVMAETNATTYGFDGFELYTYFVNDEDRSLKFQGHLTISGEPLEDRLFSGDSISMDISCLAIPTRRGWKVESYELDDISIDWPD